MLEKYFEKLPRYFGKVKCKVCYWKFDYINIFDFSHHVLRKHKHIEKFEIQNNPFKKSCRNLKYVNDLLYKCDICQQQVSSDTAALLNHRMQR